MLWSTFLIFVLTAFGLTAILTYLVKNFAVARGVVDYPDSDRKIHTEPKALLGGWAIYLVFTTLVLGAIIFTDILPGKDTMIKSLLGILLAGFIIMIGGWLDDYIKLKPTYQLIAPILAIIVVIVAGVGVKAVTNPLGGLVHLDLFKWEIVRLNGVPYYFTLLADIVTFVWLLGMMYTTKLLDGLDGLATGVGVIGGLVIFGLTQVTPFYQPSVGLLAIILAGALLGFLIWNWHPARIFLGEGGSLFIGFMLGVLAIISGSKIATALLVMGIPILDVVWIIIRRVFWEKRSLAQADKRHLHHRLLDIGLSQPQAVLVLYFLTACFGVTALFLGSRGKLIALGVLVLVMLLLAGLLVWIYQNKKNRDGFS